MRKYDIIYIFVAATLIILGIAMIGYIVQEIKKEIRCEIPDPTKVEILNKSAMDYMKGFLAARGEQTARHDEVVDQAKQIIEESDAMKAADFRYPIAQRFLMLNGIKRKKVVRSVPEIKSVWVKEKR